MLLKEEILGTLSYPGGIECHHHLPRFEGVDDVFDEFHVVLNKLVGFKADIAEGSLRSDMDSCVISQTSRAVLLEKKDFSLIISYFISHLFTSRKMAFMEYPQGSKRQESILMPGTSMFIPDF